MGYGLQMLKHSRQAFMMMRLSLCLVQYMYFFWYAMAVTYPARDRGAPGTALPD